MFLNLISVFIGGGLGAILRYVLTSFSKKLFIYPIYGTLFSNVLGCFLIGCFFGFVLKRFDIADENLKLFIVTGFLGGLTTFSTFNFEIFELIKEGKFLLAIIYLLFSLMIGILSLYMGYCLVSKI